MSLTYVHNEEVPGDLLGGQGQILGLGLDLVPCVIDSNTDKHYGVLSNHTSIDKEIFCKRHVAKSRVMLQFFPAVKNDTARLLLSSEITSTYHTRKFRENITNETRKKTLLSAASYKKTTAYSFGLIFQQIYKR